MFVAHVIVTSGPEALVGCREPSKLADHQLWLIPDGAVAGNQIRIAVGEYGGVSRAHFKNGRAASVFFPLPSSLFPQP